MATPTWTSTYGSRRSSAAVRRIEGTIALAVLTYCGRFRVTRLGRGIWLNQEHGAPESVEPPCWGGIPLTQDVGGPRATELGLVRRVIAGDAEAREQFSRDYRPLVQSTVRNTAVLPPHDYDDLCQVVFTRLLDDDCRRLRSYRGTARLTTWLMVVTRRVCLDHAKELQREQERLSEIGENMVGHSDPPSPSDLAVGDALRRLGPTDQLIVRLFYEHELSYAEIADAVKMPVNTVASRLHRARRRLKVMLQEAGFE